MIWLERARSWAVRLIGSTEALLSPPGRPCPVCGRAATDARKPLFLCGDCSGHIPWILDVRCDSCGRFEACADCSRRPDREFVRNRSAVRYNETMKTWLALYKYRGKESLRDVLGPMLLHAYHLHRQSQPQGQAGALAARELVTYVPLSAERFRERGFNQAEQLARRLGELAQLPVMPLLARMRHTDKQSFKGRAQRLDDLRGVFGVDRAGVDWLRAQLGHVAFGQHPGPQEPAGRQAGLQNRLSGGSDQTSATPIRVYVVDDVYTTGSTLNECARTLKEIYPAIEIYGISWAR